MPNDAIDQMNAVLQSEEWMANYAESLFLTVETLFEWAEYYLETGYVTGHLRNVTTDPQFWDHYETIRGVKVGRHGNFFQCSDC